MKRVAFGIAAGVAGVGVLFLFSLYLLWSYVVVVPARPIAAQEAVTLVGAPGAPPGPSGGLLIPGVRIVSANLPRALEAWFGSAHYELVPRRDVLPDGVTAAEVVLQQRQEFEESALLAAVVGLRLAGRRADIDGDGAEVTAVLTGTPALGMLDKGDRIVELDGEPVRLAGQLSTRTALLPTGTPVTLALQDPGGRRTVQVTTATIPGQNQIGIGALAVTLNRRVSLPPGVSVNTSRTSTLGGPSGGLMLSLDVYQRFRGVDLGRGRKIAGTGSIDLAGRVAPVGGVKEKLWGAHRSGASVFLAPALEVEEAQAAAPAGMEVIGVRTVEEAIARLTAG